MTSQQIYWYKTQPTTPVPADSHFAIANQFLAVDQFSAIGDYTFYAMHKANGCWSEPATGTYSVLPLPEAPVVELKASCSNDAMLPLILTQSNSGVEWKKDSTLAQNLGNLASFTPTASVLATDTSTTFFVRYNNGSCWSPYGTAQYVYIEQPLAPQVSTKAICLGDDNIEPLVAVGSLNTTWFDAQDNTLGTGRTLDLNTYPLENSGTYIFKLNNTKYTNLVADMACPSETTTASLIVSSIPNGKVWGKKDGVRKLGSERILCARVGRRLYHLCLVYFG
ncbi:MAG: hypothetical protein IPO21_07520 [Bacteroidales bacterium]|nr:hypothetical protein [Bacteroidales bacterium]